MNITLSLLQPRTTDSEVLQQLVSRYGVSRRQAYRYLRQAHQLRAPLPIPEDKSVFTVKLPSTLIRQVRKQARQQRCSISLWVEHALRFKLDGNNGHG